MVVCMGCVYGCDGIVCYLTGMVSFVLYGMVRNVNMRICMYVCVYGWMCVCVYCCCVRMYVCMCLLCCVYVCAYVRRYVGK